MIDRTIIKYVVYTKLAKFPMGVHSFIVQHLERNAAFLYF